jgi:putative transcription factor
MSFQDWTPIVLKKTNPVVALHTKQVDPEAKKAWQLEHEDRNTKRFGQENGKTMQKARCELKLTQEQLAQKLNVQTAVVKSYENGTAIPEQNLLNRINRVLHTLIKIEK